MYLCFRIKDRSNLKNVSATNRVRTDSKLKKEHNIKERSSQSSRGKISDEPCRCNVNAVPSELDTDVASVGDSCNYTGSNSTTSAIDSTSYHNLVGDACRRMNGIADERGNYLQANAIMEFCSLVIFVNLDGLPTAASISSQSYSATRLKENPSYSRFAISRTF